MTTDQVFGEKLHTYTVVDAIRDKNVLPFRVDYVSTMREQENIADAKVWDIDRERILLAPERINNIVKYILEHFDQKTKRNTYYQLRERRLAGLNSVLATASIDAATRYCAEFKKQMADLPSDKFQNYYTKVSQRLKDREIDLLIFVNMFLTGFDATTLNIWDNPTFQIPPARYNMLFTHNLHTRNSVYLHQ